ncbi:GTP-binding protein, partial [archaeon]
MYCALSTQMSKETYRYIIIGDTAVGKSSLMLQFTERKFNEEHDMTLGVEMGSRKVQLASGEFINVEIWDTAGQESYLSITRSYYRGADGCLLVFDLSNKLSFENLSMWLSEARQNSNNPNLVILMIGNKADLTSKRQVSAEEAGEFAKANGLTYLELSAQNCIDVEEAFVQTADEISKKLVSLGKPKKVASNSGNVLRLETGPAAGGRGRG